MMNINIITTTTAKTRTNQSQIEQALQNAAAGVSIISVTKKYGSFTAVENLTLKIPAGYYCCLHDPSRCGKTTALRMIAGQEEVTNGNIFIGDRYHDILGARQNQVNSIGVTYGSGTSAELIAAGATYLCNNPEEIVTCIKNNQI